LSQKSLSQKKISPINSTAFTTFGLSVPYRLFLSHNLGESDGIPRDMWCLFFFPFIYIFMFLFPCVQLFIIFVTRKYFSLENNKVVLQINALITIVCIYTQYIKHYKHYLLLMRKFFWDFFFRGKTFKLVNNHLFTKQWKY
jgi:hypothetical protein